MIDIKRTSALRGAEKYGECSACGCGSDSKTIYKVIFSPDKKQSSSVRLCHDCIDAFSSYVHRVMRMYE